MIVWGGVCMDRILFLLDSLSDVPSSRVLGQWIMNLQQRGHLVQICLRTDREAQDQYLPFCPCKVIPRPVLSPISGLYPSLYYGRYTDLVIADQSSFSMGCLSLFPGTCRKAAWIGQDIRRFTPRLLTLYQKCDQIFCSSDRLREEFQKYFFRSGRLQTLCLPKQELPPRRVFLYSHCISASLLNLLQSLQDPRWELWIWGDLDPRWQDSLAALHATLLSPLPGYAPLPPADLILGPEPVDEEELPSRMGQMLRHPLLPSIDIPSLAKEPLHAIYHLSP